jgi:hypothetical protein
MGAAESHSLVQGAATEGDDGAQILDKGQRQGLPSQFVLVVTAPPGTGKKDLMALFMSQHSGKIAYVQTASAATATQPVRSVPTRAV